MIIGFLIMLYAVLNALDVITTIKALRLGGHEVNPLVRILLKYRLFIPWKIVATIIVAAVISNAEEAIGICIGLVLCGIYGAVVGYNLRVIRELSS